MVGCLFQKNKSSQPVAWDFLNHQAHNGIKCKFQIHIIFISGNLGHSHPTNNIELKKNKKTNCKYKYS